MHILILNIQIILKRDSVEIINFLLSFTGPCVDNALQNVKNLASMKNGGWIDNGLESRVQSNGRCGPPHETFWGYINNKAVGYVKASFKGSGKGILDFENCYDYGKTVVYLNDQSIAEVGKYGRSTVAFNTKRVTSLR